MTCFKILKKTLTISMQKYYQSLFICVVTFFTFNFTLIEFVAFYQLICT